MPPVRPGSSAVISLSPCCPDPAQHRSILREANLFSFSFPKSQIIERNCMRRHCPYLFVFLFLFVVTVARATIFGGVRGIVHDPQHKPVANASLTLKSATSDWSQETQSNADG